MPADQLHVLTARFNPLRWRTPDRNFQAWSDHMLDSGVKLTVCELQYGDRPFTCDRPHLNHIGVRADSWCWSKENLLNIAMSRLPDARYICWEDADILHRDKDWAARTVEALQHSPVVQTWTQCVDFGPEDEVCAIHRSLADLYQRGKPVTKDEDRPWWTREGGKHEYAHPGFSWACRRELIEETGGFLDNAVFGSGDFHMALAMLGKAEWSLARGVGPSYRRLVLAWQARAAAHVRGKMGVVPGTIEHRFHGRRRDRRHLDRWELLIRHQFDPVTDIRRNRDGVLEWAGNKPRLQLDWDRYLHSRNEDANWL